MRTILCVIVAALCMSLTSAHAAAASAHGCNGFTGLWNSQWEGGGPVALRIKGNSGTYDWKSGTLTGSINATTFSGTYKQSDQTGEFQFTLSADGDSFDGWYMIDGTTDKVDWKATCSGSSTST